MKIEKYKRHGKTAYRFFIRVGDVVTRRSGFKTTTEAIRAYDELYQELSDKRDNKTYKEVFDEWLIIYKTKVKESTYQRNLATFNNHILKYFGNKYLKDIEVSDCQKFALDYVSYVKGKEMFNQAKRVMEYAVKMQYIDENPFNKVVLPNFKKPNREINFLDINEVNILLDYIKDDLYWYCLFRLMIYSGIRRGEVLALTWNDINFKNKTLNIDKSLSIGLDYKVILSTTKTEKSKREILLDDKTIINLKKLKLQKQSEIIFCNSKGDYRRLSDISDKLKQIIKHTNIKDIRVHDLRHTHASLLFASGANAKEVQDRLGHTDIKTTLNIYTHVTKDNTEKTVDRFVDYLENTN